MLIMLGVAGSLMQGWAVARRILPWWVDVGRSFESIRMGVKDVSARWLKASKALKKEDQIYGQKVAEMAKKHSSEAFYAFDDPLEAEINTQ